MEPSGKMEPWMMILLVILPLAIAYFFGQMIGHSRGYREARRKDREAERKQRRDDKDLSGRENIANRFANVVDKSDLVKHYEVRRSKHRLGIADFLDFVRRDNGLIEAAVEINFSRQFEYRVIIRASNDQGWHFGSDNDSLDEATDLLRAGLEVQAS